MLTIINSLVMRNATIKYDINNSSEHAGKRGIKRPRLRVSNHYHIFIPVPSLEI